ncbi:MAG TPA: RNA-directed DNA polymerase [Cyclobacteriaceae bacterium]|nr:RNA-directed DNA polymerase [Cyclobacteriaceae bacterium]HRF33656.1 RNA-directed DNA polymerase [Cyclobacteriaceae bacterium]
MLQEEYTSDQMRAAYAKYKSHVYYDTTELFQRKQLAVFETGIGDEITRSHPRVYKIKEDFFQFAAIDLNQKFAAIAEGLTNYHSNPEFIDHFLDQIKLTPLPKNFVDPKKRKEIQQNVPSQENFITNKREDETYLVDRLSIFISLPVELHLISVLWLMQYGYRLDKKLGDECLGNRLILNQDKTAITEGSGLFKPYFNQYQKWRDLAVEEAQRRLANGESIALLNLDVKDYFYSVRIDFKEIEKELGITEGSNLHKVFKKIHSVFTDLLVSKNIPHTKIGDEIGTNVILPIGMTSSYVLANWYLTEFDDRIRQKIRPIYFSRYVDDILIVIPKPDFDFNKNESCAEVRFDFDKYRNNEFNVNESISFDYNNLPSVEKYVLETFYPVLKLVDFPEHLKSKYAKEGSDKYIFKITCAPDCYIQSDKTLLYFFDEGESTTVIDKLKQELEERSSEFRDFPEDSKTEDSFDEQAYHLIFDGTEGKIRTLKDYKENRYGLSVFLAKRIFSALRSSKPVDKKESEKVLKLFKGLNSLDYYRLWEKLFAYFLVIGDHESFIEFYRHTTNQIEKLSFEVKGDRPGVTEREITATLFQYFDITVELAFALNPTFLDKSTDIGKQFEILQNSLKLTLDFKADIKNPQPNLSTIERFRESNMIRHHYVSQPLLNYTKGGAGDKLNLVSRKLPARIENQKLYELSEHATTYSPRRVKFWECCIYVATKRILSASLSEPGAERGDRYFYTNILHFEHEINPVYLDEAFQLYYEINVLHGPKTTLSLEEYKKQFYDLFITSTDLAGVSVRQLRIEPEKKFDDKIKISFANIKLDYNNFLSSLRGRPNLGSDRYQTFTELLNASQHEGANLFLLPECSVPYELLPSFAQYSERNLMAVVAGLEHWRVNNLSFNFIVTILPVEVDGVKDAVVVYRLKNHYSLHEEMDVRGNGAVVPKPKPYRYDLFNWRGLYFSPYYCVELADIYHRSIFRSKVDLIIASEWNQDTNYFSNIVESLSRDLHTYVAQVNNSEFGDSRLTQPSKTEKKDLLRLKGGVNSTILIGEIDIEALREFQRKHYELTKDDKTFKPVPPDLNREDVLIRINNERHFK